jgi:hypothetical protein
VALVNSAFNLTNAQKPAEQRAHPESSETAAASA